jgi:hypothetical protein
MRWRCRTRPRRAAPEPTPDSEITFAESQFRRLLLAAFLKGGINVNAHRLGPRSDRHARAEHDTC